MLPIGHFPTVFEFLISYKYKILQCRKFWSNSLDKNCGRRDLEEAVGGRWKDASCGKGGLWEGGERERERERDVK